MKKIIASLLIMGSLLGSTTASATTVGNQRDNLFYEFTILFKETVKVSKELPNDPSLQGKYDYLMKRLNEIKTEHAKLVDSFL